MLCNSCGREITWPYRAKNVVQFQCLRGFTIERDTPGALQFSGEGSERAGFGIRGTEALEVQV